MILPARQSSAKLDRPINLSCRGVGAKAEVKLHARRLVRRSQNCKVGSAQREGGSGLGYGG